jgi:hypothetical protein
MFIIAAHKSHLHLLTANITIFQKKKVSFIRELKMYSYLPQSLKNLSLVVRWFRLALKRILLKNAFYSLEEYLSCKSHD